MNAKFVYNRSFGCLHSSMCFLNRHGGRDILVTLLDGKVEAVQTGPFFHSNIGTPFDEGVNDGHVTTLACQK